MLMLKIQNDLESTHWFENVKREVFLGVCKVSYVNLSVENLVFKNLNFFFFEKILDSLKMSLQYVEQEQGLERTSLKMK